jgi:hypothetical protein
LRNQVHQHPDLKRPSVRAWLRGALPLVVAALIGCGGGGASDSSTPAPTPPAPTPVPPAVALAVAPDTVQQSASANLTWSSTNSSSCVASGGWSGSKALTGTESTGALNAATAYTLTCSGAGGTAGQTVNAGVAPPPTAPQPPTVTLAVAPGSVVSGSAATLTWSSTNATACAASGNWSGARATSGSASTGVLTANSAFALTCTGAGGSATQSVNVTVTQPAAPSVTLTASPTTVALGGSTTLNWSSSNAASCAASGGWTGTKALSGSEARAGLAATTTYTLMCTGPGGTASQSVTVTVASGPTPPSVSLSATPSSVISGNSSTLSWTSANATACTASGGWSGSKSANGSEVRPNLTATATYTLTCTGSGGSAAQSVTVTVNPAPMPTVSLTATPASVVSGGSSTLNWSSTNASSCTATGGWSGAKGLTGTEVRGGLTSTTSYTLSCTGAGGTATQTVTVNVTPATPPPTLALSANPTAVLQGNSSTLTWSSSNATSCAATGDWTGGRATNASESTGALSAVRTYTYTLSCTGAGGSTSRTATVAVGAVPVPTVTISANPAQVAQGGTSNLTWSSTNAQTCTASGGWSGARATAGTLTTSALTQTTTYTLTCSGLGGSGSGSTTVTVSPVTPAPTLTLTATPSAITQGGSSTLSWTTTNATSCVASGDWNGSRNTSGTESTGALSTVRTYSYTLNCSGPGGTTGRTATVAVSATPPVPTVSISANPTQVGNGGTSTLTWTSSNATSCTASSGWSGNRPTSGTFVTPALTQSTSFVLACIGTGGTGTGSATVTVTAPPATTAFPLRVGSGQRHLVDQNGRQFLMVGDTPWSLMTGVTKAEAEAYLEDRRQRGFNAIIVNIIEHYYNGPINREGNAPFQRTNNVYDFSKPVEAYFANVDYVLGLARDKGFLVLLTPAYLGYNGGSEGWWPEINTSVNTEAVMENYGRYVGTRYRNFNNIIWVMGGDWYGQQSLPKTQALVRGLQATDQAGRLYTAHNARQESGYQFYGSEPWFTVNNTYSDCALTPQRSIDDYNRARVMPFFYFEGRYENESSTTQVCLRSQAYWPVLLGSVGSFFGNRPIWLFDPGWQAALGSQGTQNMAHFGRLFKSRAWDKLVPDLNSSVLTAGRGSLGTDYAAAARTNDGATIIVYTPSQKSLTIDMSRISGASARAWWFNPATGAASLIGDYANSGSRSFTPPAAGDWVLVIDNAALGLAAPGQ